MVTSVACKAKYIVYTNTNFIKAESVNVMDFSEVLQGVKFLFFPIFWPASYFLLFFQEIPSFSYFFRV